MSQDKTVAAIICAQKRSFWRHKSFAFDGVACKAGKQRRGGAE
ncbi:MAG TPA: hypothetical protein VJ461_05665 [Candidatus Nanoarchaeia archaeon]|nr:hypothetical protein [Candidatus Nanoarchaeia archaeon]